MNDKESKLEKNEMTLFYGIPLTKQSNKQKVKCIILAIIIIFLCSLLFIEIINNSNKVLLCFTIILIILFICFLSQSIYFYITHNNNEYYITTKKVAIYNSKKGYQIAQIKDIQDITVTKEYGKYGDLEFIYQVEDKVNKKLKFIGVENPQKIIELIMVFKKNIELSKNHKLSKNKKRKK